MATISGGAKLEAHFRQIAAKVARKATVKIGFLEGATYPDGTSVPMVAAIQEFGAPSRGIPPRPFMRKTVQDKADSWGPATANLLKANDYDAAKTLGQVGEGIKGQIQQAIRDVTEPPLSPVTLLLRERFGNNPHEITGSDVAEARGDIAAGIEPEVSGTQAKPLVWTGHLLNSVDYEVTEE